MLGNSKQKQMSNEQTFYLRYHNSISRAIQLNSQIFGNTVGKDGNEPRFQHSLRVAGYCEEILDQTMEQYHQGWLLGIMHDNKQQNPVLFSQKIDDVLQDLYPQQQIKIKRYINDLTSDKSLSKGQQKRQQLIKIQQLDLTPSWILIFDKLDNCKRFKKNGVGKTKQQLDGYYAVAYLIYLEARRRHKQIRQFMLEETNTFYQAMGQELGGEQQAKKIAQKYCSTF